MALGKPTWFKMDPAAFFSDAAVDAMSTLELGACFRLLARQWIDGYIPDDLRLLARLCRLDTGSMAEAWVTLCIFFPIIEPGKRANRFMWIEREKVVVDLERRSDEGTRAANKRWNEVRKKRDATPIAKPNGSPMPDPMQEKSRAEKSGENPSSEQNSRSEQEDASSSKKTAKPLSREACRLAALLKSEILRNKPDYRITALQLRKWELTADRMLRIDRRPPELIAKLIRWVQHDEFWMANVLSMDTLREKFDQLELKCNCSNGDGHSPRKAPGMVGSAVENTLALLKGGAE